MELCTCSGQGSAGVYEGQDDNGMRCQAGLSWQGPQARDTTVVSGTLEDKLRNRVGVHCPQLR